MAATGDILRTEVVDERAARRSLREQIARLERELATVVVAGFPRLDPGPPVGRSDGPRLLALGDLERTRDALAGRLGGLRAIASVSISVPIMPANATAMPSVTDPVR